MFYTDLYQRLNSGGSIFIGSSSLSYLRWFVSEKTVLFYSQRIPVANCPQIYPLEKSLFFCRNKQKYTCLWSINIKFDFSCTVYKAATYSIYFSYGYYCMKKERTKSQQFCTITAMIIPYTMQGAKSSAAIVSSLLTRNDPVSRPEGLHQTDTCDHFY